MVQLFVLVNRFAGQLYAQLVEYLDIHIGEHHGGVNLAASELWQLV